MRDLPPPLPPGERTVGQLVGETMRIYGSMFWRALPLGLGLAIIDQARVHRSVLGTALVYLAGAPLLVACYVAACCLVLRTKPTRASLVLAFLVYLPFPVLNAFLILPGLVWFAFVGLAVPAALAERLGIRAALKRGRELGRADFVHALGSLSALVVVVGVAAQTLSTLLHTQGSSSARAALALADLVLTPLLYLGGAMLYFDQAARVGMPRRARDGGAIVDGAAPRQDIDGAH